MRKVRLAKSICPELCECGCGHVYVYLMDEKGNDFARFSLANCDWVPFGEECARLSRGEKPHGQNGHLGQSLQ